MLKAARVSVLILLLSCSAQAGYIQTGGSPEPPPPQPATAVNEPAVACLETSADSTLQAQAPSALTQVTLELLAALPSFF